MWSRRRAAGNHRSMPWDGGVRLLRAIRSGQAHSTRDTRCSSATSKTPTTSITAVAATAYRRLQHQQQDVANGGIEPLEAAGRGLRGRPGYRSEGLQVKGAHKPVGCCSRPDGLACRGLGAPPEWITTIRTPCDRIACAHTFPISAGSLTFTTAIIPWHNGCVNLL